MPDFESRFFAVPALAAKTGRLGKCVAPRFAERYVGQLTLAAAILPESALETLARGAAPPPETYCFDSSLAIGDWIPSDGIKEMQATLSLTGPDDDSSASAKANVADLYPLIAGASARNTIKMGDVMILPIPALAFEAREGMTMTLSTPLCPRPLLITKFK